MGSIQPPDGKEEDLDGGFKHGGCSMPFFEPETIGAKFDEMTKPNRP